MNYKLSKLAKAIIIINVVLTLIVAIIHGYNLHRIQETQEKIVKVMKEEKVIRDTAIRILEKDGEELFIDRGITTYFGVTMSILTLILLYKFSKENGFFFGFSAAFCSLFTSYVGGLLLFFVILSGKSQISGKRKAPSLKDEWGKYVYKKAITDNTEAKV